MLLEEAGKQDGDEVPAAKNWIIFISAHIFGLFVVIVDQVDELVQDSKLE